MCCGADGRGRRRSHRRQYLPSTTKTQGQPGERSTARRLTDCPGSRRPATLWRVNLLALVQKLLLVAARLLPGALRAEEMTVYFFDVGQGDAALVVSPVGKTVLIDGGPPSAGPALGARLKKILNAPVDLVVLSHPHLDHLGGLAEAIRSMGARMFMEPNFNHPSPAYEKLLDTLKERNVKLMIGEGGRNIGLGGGANLKLLLPSEPYIQGSRSDVNSNSIIARLSWENVSFLFTGDAERPTEQRLLGLGEDLRATVLKVAHHGSRHTTSSDFLAKVKPEAAVISCGAGNDYGHPTREAMDRLEDAKARIYRTDLDGEIVVKTDGRRIRVTTSKQGVPAPEGREVAAGAKEPAREPQPAAAKEPVRRAEPAVAREPVRTTPAAESKPVASGDIVGSSRSDVFHVATCRNAKKIKPDNLVSFRSREDAIAKGKRPAKDCNP